MPHLRNKLKQQFVEQLDNSAFTSNDFNIEFRNGEEKEDRSLVKISLAHAPKYQFILFNKEDGPSGRYFYEKVPGDTFEMDSYYLDSIHEALEVIANWAISVREELKAEYFLLREVDEIKRLLEEQLSIGKPGTEYSHEEAELLKSKFDALEKRFEKLEEESAITAKQLETIIASIEQVKEDIDIYPKETWVKTASNKVYAVIQSISKSKEGRAIIASGAKKLLGLDN